MNFKDIKLTIFAKYILIGTLVVLFLTKTPFWRYIHEAMSPLILAFVLAYMMDYSVRFFEKRIKLNKGLSILFSLSIFISLLVLLGFVIIPSIIDAVSRLIQAIGDMDMNVDISFMKKFRFENIYLQQMQQNLIDSITPLLQKLTDLTGTIVLIIVGEIQKITSGLISFILSFVIAIYMLAEKKDLIARIKRFIYAYFNDKQIHWIIYTSGMSNKIFKDFVIGKLIDSTIIGFLSFFLFKMFGLEYPMLIALIVGITNMIPYFGPFFGAIPAAIITLIASPSDPIQVLYMLLLILLIQQFDGLLLGPFILGDSVGVSAFWIIVAVTVGGATFGVIGMFLGVPVFVLIKTLLEEDVKRKLSLKGYDELEVINLKTKKTKFRKKERV